MFNYDKVHKTTTDHSLSVTLLQCYLNVPQNIRMKGLQFHVNRASSLASLAMAVAKNITKETIILCTLFGKRLNTFSSTPLWVHFCFTIWFHDMNYYQFSHILKSLIQTNISQLFKIFFLFFTIKYV